MLRRRTRTGSANPPWTHGYDMDESSLLNSLCPRNLELRWQTEVSSSICATSLIADINGDGKLEVVVSTFVHYLEVLDGTDGEKMSGWHAFHQSTVHESPALYDIDKDWNREIALATNNGEVLFFRVSGYVMTDKLEVPQRKIRKNWYVGLDPDSADLSHPDVHDEQLVKNATDAQSMNQSVQNPDVNGTKASRRLLQDVDSKGSRELGGSKSGGNVTLVPKLLQWKMPRDWKLMPMHLLMFYEMTMSFLTSTLMIMMTMSMKNGGG